MLTKNFSNTLYKLKYLEIKTRIKLFELPNPNILTPPKKSVTLAVLSHSC